MRIFYYVSFEKRETGLGLLSLDSDVNLVMTINSGRSLGLIENLVVRHLLCLQVDGAHGVDIGKVELDVGRLDEHLTGKMAAKVGDDRLVLALAVKLEHCIS